MKFVRFYDGEEEKEGIVLGDKIQEIEGCMFEDFSKKENFYSYSDVTLLPPVSPKHLIAVGKSYKEHIDEMAARRKDEPEYPKQPIFFFEAPGSISSHEKPIVLPKEGSCKQVDLEGELAIVIGKKGKNIKKENALDYVFGYTCANDVSARGIPDIGGLWGIGLSKSLDTFTPIGPAIETEVDDPNNLEISSRLNGEITQKSNTKDMIFTVEDFVSYCSSRLTLYPGDVIMSGTPAGVRPLKKGDQVEVSIEKVGVLKNTVDQEEE